MSRPTLTLLVAAEGGGGTVLRAPKVGAWSDHPEDGAAVSAGSAAGTLTQLQQRFRLVIPDGVAGRIELTAGTARVVPVEFGQALFLVRQLADGGAPAGAKARATSRAAGGPLAVIAPTDGVFYRGAAADAKPFVAPGDRVVTGQPVGLIEVMKTFNPIAYAGLGLPDEACVVEILVADGQEVRAGQALVSVKPL